MAYYEALFDLINEAHIQTQHGGRDIIMDHLKHYFGIPRQAYKIFLDNCEVCQRKKKIPQKEVVIKPILSEDFNSRAQLDLIDIQANPDGDYKFLMAYQMALKWSNLNKCLKII
uniref:Integrase zinc-binding domain-containing protein n=1 Tax=Acrobeloides nanus TaxID=290746 RepID=A0A914CWL8_9BILA